jgi:hypothetical protein
VYDPDILPEEKWAIFSIHPIPHKIIGKFNPSIQASLRYNNTATYINKKYNLSTAKRANTNILALQAYLHSTPIFQRASIIKLIHGLSQMHASLCRQSRAPPQVCPRCQLMVETCDHVLICTDSTALTTRTEHLHIFLDELTKFPTSIHISSVMEYKLSLLLALPYTKARSPATILLPDAQ